MVDPIFSSTPIDGLLRVERARRGDARGFFSRFFDIASFAEAGWPGSVMQMNHTLTEEPGTIRGLHFQHAPHAEWKYVSCLAGAVFDVALDLRTGSASYGKWFGTILSADNGHSLLIPAGFAHGLQTMVPGSELIYLHSASYAPAAEGGVNALDPSLGIDWPLPIAARSARDIALPCLDQKQVPR
jgi:dTDP-4-dehydrorhamnose 3,5-epimerase